MIFNDPRVRKVFTPSENPVSWEDLDGWNIFISVPEDRLEQYGGILNMMFTLLVRSLERRPGKYSPQGQEQLPVLLMIDEFPRIGKCDVVFSAVTTLRSKGVTICLIAQSLSFLEAIYGEKYTQVILANCAYKLILNVTSVESKDHLIKLVKTLAGGHRKSIDLDLLQDAILITPKKAYRICKEPYHETEKMRREGIKDRIKHFFKKILSGAKNNIKNFSKLFADIALNKIGNFIIDLFGKKFAKNN